MRRRILTVLCMVAVGLSPSVFSEEPADAPTPIVATDFDSDDQWRLAQTLQQHDLLKTVDDEGVDGGKALKATYVGYERGSKRIVKSFKLPRQMDEATLVFDVKFDQGFQFVKSGKLNGLGPDNRITGGKPMKPEGWSARAVWQPKGLHSYVYCQNKQGKYGQGPERKARFQFKTERYYAVSIYVKLNDPVDKANGIVRVYVNGKGVAEDKGIQFRSVEGDHTRITHLMFSTFHGGQSPGYAPKDKAGNYIDVHAFFDNLAVYEGLFIREEPGSD